MPTRDTGYISAYPVVVGYADTYGVATGGTSSSITVSSQAYTLLSFTSTGTLTVSTAGLFDVLMCSGGGAGGWSISGNYAGGGGGAGGISEQTIYLSANTTIQIGAGGVATSSNATAGSTAGSSSAINSTARSLSVAGGGKGADIDGANGNYYPATSGGSGGGGGCLALYLVAGTSMANAISGYAGSNAAGVATLPSGAGGGATAAGSGNSGGAGYDVSTFIGAASALYKGGGGGGANSGTGGSSVGGAGGAAASNGNAAAANTASGGGSGGANGNAGGNGGSGIVYVRFKV